MTARRAKQIVYGALYLIVVFGVLWGAYSLFARFAPPAAPAPACSGGVGGGGIVGGAGGSAGAGCAPAGAGGIVVGALTTFVSGGPGHDTFLARVENHNIGFAARSFDYALELMDPSGTVLRSVPGSSFLYGGEVKYVVVPNVAAGAFDHAALAVQNADWVPAADLGAPPQFGNPLAVTGSGITSSTITVTGALTDGDPAAFQNIVIVAVFYGANGVAVGASETELDAIAPGETEPFSVSYPAVPNVNPLLTKLYAYALRP